MIAVVRMHGEPVGMKIRLLFPSAEGKMLARRFTAVVNCKSSGKYRLDILYQEKRAHSMIAAICLHEDEYLMRLANDPVICRRLWELACSAIGRQCPTQYVEELKVVLSITDLTTPPPAARDASAHPYGTRRP